MKNGTIRRTLKSRNAALMMSAWIGEAEAEVWKSYPDVTDLYADLESAGFIWEGIHGQWLYRPPQAVRTISTKTFYVIAPIGEYEALSKVEQAIEDAGMVILNKQEMEVEGDLMFHGLAYEVAL